MDPAQHLHDTVDAILAQHVASDAQQLLDGERLCSMAHLVVRRPDAPCCTIARGTTQLIPEPPLDALPPSTPPVFDLASVTKALVPATLCMIAVDRGLCALDTPLKDLLPDWQRREAAHHPRATLLHLLNHSSGLPAWHKYYEDGDFLPFPPEPAHTPALRARMLQDVFSRERHTPGTRYAYSDLGYMVGDRAQ